MNHAADPADRSGRHAVIMALIHVPGRGRDGSPEDVLRYFGTYLEWDESRALARKAIHALGKTPGSEASEALTELTSSGSEIVRETASRVLQHRQKH